MDFLGVGTWNLTHLDVSNINKTFATRFIPWCLTNESNEWSFLVETPQSMAPALRLAYFQDDAANVVMSLAKQARWEHAVELAQRRGKRNTTNGPWENASTQTRRDSV